MEEKREREEEKKIKEKKEVKIRGEEYIEKEIKEKNIEEVYIKGEIMIDKLPKMARRWEEDEKVEECNNCKRRFTIILRKHHCRLCGKIYCGRCSSYKKKIPRELLSEESKMKTWSEYFSIRKEEEKKVCVSCNIEIERINKVKKIIKVFRIIGLNVLELNKAKEKNKLWRYAANYCLTKFRDIQYKLPNEKYYEIEKDMIRANIKLIKGHSKYILGALKICETKEEINKVIEIIENEETEKIEEEIIMSSKNSKEKITTQEAIELLTYCIENRKNMKIESNRILKKYAIKNIKCEDEEMKCYIPILVYLMIYDEYHISKYVIKRCEKNIELINMLYWELNLYSEKKYEKIKKELKSKLSNKENEEKTIELMKSMAITEIIKKIGEVICEEKKSYNEVKDKFKLTEELIYPLDVRRKIKKIVVNKIKYKNSMSRPIIIPCEDEKGEEINIMYKQDNLRNDQIIMNLIKLTEIIVKREENIDLEIVTYNILPLTKNSGLIEIVEEADTIYYIREKLKVSILNYMLDKNGEMTIKEFKEKYIKSAAVYSVLTYLLGVGDRHLDNIMIKKDGRMFHIDFGYILGKDPVFKNPGIRITNDMIEAMGGLSSKYYKRFVELSTKIYNCIRRNVNIYALMLMLLPKISDIKITEKEIKKHILEKFMPGEEEYTAKFNLIEKIENQSYTDKIKDWFHYHSKEQTINSAMSRLTYAFTTFTSFSNILKNDEKETSN